MLCQDRVEIGGIEPPTSAVRLRRSSHLSYIPLQKRKPLTTFPS